MTAAADPDPALGPAAARARQAVLLRLLRRLPEGADEHTMIKAQQAVSGCRLPGGSLIDPLTLFRCHFLTYNTLYRLRERLWRQRRGHLEIGPLRTVLLGYRSGAAGSGRARPRRAGPGPGGLAGHDARRALYLDESLLTTTTEADVVALLGRFWAAFHADDERHQALQTLGLSEPADFATIQRAYRRLAMRHHPDRGGDARTLQRINAAMDVLRARYGEFGGRGPAFSAGKRRPR